MRCRAEQFEDEMAEESQGVDVQLMASQVAEYNQLKAKARKKTTMLNEQLRLVSLCYNYIVFVGVSGNRKRNRYNYAIILDK